MPGIKERRKTWVSTSSTSDGDSKYYPAGWEEPTRYCLKCEGFGFPWQELGERVYQDDELINGQPPHDSDLWLQCYRCGTITPSLHGRQEGRIKPFIEVPDSIHETGRLKIEHFITSRKRNRKDKKLHKGSAVLGAIEDDKDVQNLTKQSGREVANYSDSST